MSLWPSASASRPKFVFCTSTALRRTSGFIESGSLSAFGVRAPSTNTGMTRILRASAAAIFDHYEIVRVVEPATAIIILRIKPIGADDC